MSFADRELFDPARVMEAAYDRNSASGGRAVADSSSVDGSMDFLKQAVDLGVRMACACSHCPLTMWDQSHVVRVRVCAQTSIMAVAFEGGVILGADSRVSTGGGTSAVSSAHNPFSTMATCQESVQSRTVILERCLTLLSGRRVHLQPSVGQDHFRRRAHLLLPLRLRSRHTGCV